MLLQPPQLGQSSTEKYFSLILYFCNVSFCSIGLVVLDWICNEPGLVIFVTWLLMDSNVIMHISFLIANGVNKNDENFVKK